DPRRGSALLERPLTGDAAVVIRVHGKAPVAVLRSDDLDARRGVVPDLTFEAMDDERFPGEPLIRLDRLHLGGGPHRPGILLACGLPDSDEGLEAVRHEYLPRPPLKRA